MSGDDIKPVAWQYKNGKRWETVSENTYTVYCVGRKRRSLYDQSAIDRLTAERDAAVADARRWNELCRQIDAGTFPSVVIEDAMEMGSGALELQVDASMAENGK